MASTDIYHKAAKDGYLTVLKETTRRDCNAKDEDGMTPTLWAAFEGNVEALRVLVGRGGDPDKADNYGNTALHLAAAKGHIQCVTFLVNFGVNVYALDIDLHSAQELAAMNDQVEILRYLDATIAKLETEDPKKAKKMADKSIKEAEKLSKAYKKLQMKADKLILREHKELTRNMKKMELDSSNDEQDNRRFSNKIAEEPPTSNYAANIAKNLGKKSFGSVLKKVRKIQ